MDKFNLVVRAARELTRAVQENDLSDLNNINYSNMSKRTYIATFWRSNPQLKNGGYFTTKEFQSVSLQGATKQAERYAASNMYGGMAVKSVELKQENSNGK